MDSSKTGDESKNAFYALRSHFLGLGSDSEKDTFWTFSSPVAGFGHMDTPIYRGVSTVHLPALVRNHLQHRGKDSPRLRSPAARNTPRACPVEYGPVPSNVGRLD